MMIIFGKKQLLKLLALRKEFDSEFVGSPYFLDQPICQTPQCYLIMCWDLKKTGLSVLELLEKVLKQEKNMFSTLLSGF
ncbi:unnamed protein product [Meloidogyne enterolobii]|uniref:Uncharacterized protein n=1 Tax=Meloidogyne enterolobii TaxID=390850 RepID=A0ACB0Y6D2_MELEN